MTIQIGQTVNETCQKVKEGHSLRLFKRNGSDLLQYLETNPHKNKYLLTVDKDRYIETLKAEGLEVCDPNFGKRRHFIRTSVKKILKPNEPGGPPPTSGRAQIKIVEDFVLHSFLYGGVVSYERVTHGIFTVPRYPGERLSLISKTGVDMSFNGEIIVKYFAISNEWSPWLVGTLTYTADLNPHLPTFVSDYLDVQEVTIEFDKPKGSFGWSWVHKSGEMVANWYVFIDEVRQ